MTTENRFLTHIGSLRGLAIIFIVLFHLDGQMWANGYLGVDVFLVITGYLLFRARTAQPDFSTLSDTSRFALKRIRRIFPPMLIVVLLTLIAGAFLMWQDDEYILARVGSYACTARVNILLATEFDNYFAPNSKFIPLLHLWYLAVTLQIYLIWAVGNLAIQRLPKRWIVFILVVIGLASFCYNGNYVLRECLKQLGLPVWNNFSPVSYYSTLPRLWEVLAGGLVLLLPSISSKKCVTALSGLSLAGIVALCLIPGGGIHNSISASLVVICTVLVIRYFPESYIRCLLDNKLFLWLGGISFSLYLVHMPIIVFGHIWVFGNPQIGYDALLLALSLFAAWGYWWCVEKRRFPWYLIIVLWGLTYATCKLGRKTHGFSNYLSQYETVLETSSYPQWQRSVRQDLLADMPEDLIACAGNYYHGPQTEQNLPKPRLLDIGNHALSPTVVLMGDSHADHFYAGFDRLFHEKGLSGVYLTSIVWPFRGREYYSDAEYNWNEKKDGAVLQWLKRHPEITHVVIGQWWAERFRKEKLSVSENQLRLFLQDLREMGKQVILIADTPEFSSGLIQHYVKILTYRGVKPGDPSTFSDTCSREEHLDKHKDVYPILKKLEGEGLCKVVDPLLTLAPGECFHSLRGNVSLMLDDNHMYPAFSIEMAARLWPQLQAVLPAGAAPAK